VAGGEGDAGEVGMSPRQGNSNHEIREIREIEASLFSGLMS
jgi:hypothetical protein